MIRLTFDDGKFAYVAADKIVIFKEATEPGKTAIVADGQFLIVTESPSEVARKVLEYKLAMARYRAIVTAEATSPGDDGQMLAWARDVERSILNQLAGLEDTNESR